MIKKELIIETDIEMEDGYGYYVTPINNKLCIFKARLPKRKPYGKYRDEYGNPIPYHEWKELNHDLWKEQRRREYEYKSGGYKYGYSSNHNMKGGLNGNTNQDTANPNTDSTSSTSGSN